MRWSVCDVGSITNLTLVWARAFSADVLLYWWSESIVFIYCDVLYPPILSKVLILAHYTLISQRWWQSNYIYGLFLDDSYLAVFDAFRHWLLSWVLTDQIVKTGIQIWELLLMVERRCRKATLGAALIHELRLRCENVFLWICSTNYSLLVSLSSCVHYVLRLRWLDREDLHAFTIFWFCSIHQLEITVLQVLLQIILILVFTHKIIFLLDSRHLLLLKGCFIMVLIRRMLDDGILFDEFLRFLELERNVFICSHLLHLLWRLSVNWHEGRVTVFSFAVFWSFGRIYQFLGRWEF